MAVTYAQAARRVARTGTVTVGTLVFAVPGELTVGEVADLLGPPAAETLLRTGRLEVAGRHAKFVLLYTLIPEHK